ncbi:enolase-phosphatase E1-like [Camellia sinensis]|uniref:enolase-phosphatase E1-like n=1 Tax=Camellia sinensis TaxID=4442 RepID=UPI001036B7AB|nr:enolase-phosphatase E1-like [Camellia sinensis]
MGHKKVVADDLLADIPDTVTAQPAPSQPQPKSKPKKLKKAQPKATASPITIEDKSVRASDNVDDIEVGVALSTALLLLQDLNRNAEMNEYENFALMLQHSVQAIQHGHSFAMHAFNIKKELANKTKEATGLQRTINKAEAKMKTLINQAEEAKRAKDEAEEKADAAEAIAKALEAEKNEAQVKTVEAQAELRAALSTKEAEIKVIDEKAYTEGAADVKEDYKKQPRPAIPHSQSQSEDEAESEDDTEVEKNKEAAGAKSPTLNEQVLDLTHDEEDEVSKGDSAEKTSSEAPIAEKSLDETLKEIDPKLTTEKAAEKSSQISFEPQTQPANDAK